MRCPKCAFITFDHVAACPKCNASLGKVSGVVQGTSLNVEPPSFLGAFAKKSQPEASVDDLLDAPDLVLSEGKQRDNALGDLDSFAGGDDLAEGDLLFDDAAELAGSNGDELPELELTSGGDYSDDLSNPSLQKLTSNLSDIDISDLMPGTNDYAAEEDLDEIPTLEPLSFDQEEPPGSGQAAAGSFDLGSDLLDADALDTGLDDIDLDSISFSDLESQAGLLSEDDLAGLPSFEDAGQDYEETAYAPELEPLGGTAEDDGLSDFADLLTPEDELSLGGSEHVAEEEIDSMAEEVGGFDLNFDDKRETGPMPSDASPGEISLELDNSEGPLGASTRAGVARPDIPDLGLTLESDD